MRISDWSSDVCSSDLRKHIIAGGGEEGHRIGAIERVAAHEIAAVDDARRTGQRPDDVRIVGQAVEQQPRRAVEREGIAQPVARRGERSRSEEHTSELQSLMRISYAVFCLKKKKTHTN